MPKLSISKILDKTFQDDVELAFSDQIPLATAVKKGYNFLHNVTTNIVADIGFKNDCGNRYIQLGESTVSYGCDKNLVYYPGYISYDKESYDNRIASINKTLANTPVDTYIILTNILLLMLFIMCIVYLTSSSYNPFIYFRF